MLHTNTYRHTKASRSSFDFSSDLEVKLWLYARALVDFHRLISPRLSFIVRIWPQPIGPRAPAIPALRMAAWYCAV